MWRLKIALVVLAAIALFAGLLLYGKTSSALYLGSGALDRAYYLTGASVVLSCQALVLTVILLMRLFNRAHNRRLLRLLYQESQLASTEREILWGDKGLLIQGRDHRQRVPWNAVAELTIEKEAWFLAVRQLGVSPIPAEALDEMPDKAALLALIRGKISQAGSGRDP